jgi:UDP:flavonoid glycosyltransferase YjiC (YdhE family)
MARIVLSTLGSLGDLHPYLALGVALRERGHDVVLATHPLYRALAGAARLEFAPVRPDLDVSDLDDVMRRAMDLRTGSQFVLRHFILEPLRESTEDSLAAFAGADLVVSHVLSLAGVLACEKLDVPRVHTVLQPLAMWSATDPPVTPALPASEWLARHLPAPAWRILWAMGRAWSRPWFARIDAQRRELGLPRASAHPLMQMWSPDLNLALFSPLFSPPQPDWPPHTIATGFPEWRSGEALPVELEAFLAAGEPPIVFTLGSSAVYAARDFWLHAARATRTLGRRAVFLTGLDVDHELPAELLGPHLMTVPYAAHTKLFPRAAAIVHQGGIGTTARGLASGRPMLIVPFSHDQPDNAARCVRLGVAHTLSRATWRADRATSALERLLGDAPLRKRAAGVGARIAAEDGAASAADAIAAALRLRLVRSASPA